VAVLECRGIAKRYGSAVAVRGASLVFCPGQIHAVVGENGAGKSTLLKIACGLVRPDSGQVSIDGRELVPHTPKEALRRHVAMVQQHFALVLVMTALENIVLGAEPALSFGRVDWALARKKVGSIAEELGVTLPLDARVETLGVGDRQRIEIARALYRDAQVLVLDEPTSVLAPQEADALYAALRRLANGGRTLAVVTHKLDEVRAHADLVTAMRRGEIVRHEARSPTEELDIDALADAIMGADKPEPVSHSARAAGDCGEAVLTVKSLVFDSVLDIASLEVRAREIVGIAGVEGNGQRELVRILAGLLEPTGGELDLPGGSPAVVHEDRQVEGLVLDATVTDNLVLGELARFERYGVLDGEAMRSLARERMERGGIRPPDLDLSVRALSGGNQQKIVTVRAVSRGRLLLVLAHPTRGVDLGAARGIHAQILEAASRGAGVLVVSSDLSELRTLCDRILVLRRGKIVGTFTPEATDLAIGAAMLGGDTRVAASA
jgi:general nucleoside transport system ATP-binding protein